MFWALEGPQKPEAMSPPSDLQAWFREDWKRDGEKPPNPLHLDYTFSVPFPCLSSMCEGICPACSGTPASWLPSHACPFPGWCNPAICRQLWWPPHGGASHPHHVHVASCAEQHAVHLHPCMLCVLLHWERGLKATSSPHRPLCWLCALEVGAYGESVAAADRELGVWAALGGRPAQALAEAALLAHGICVQVLLATGWTLRAEAKGQAA